MPPDAPATPSTDQNPSTPSTTPSTVDVTPAETPHVDIPAGEGESSSPVDWAAESEGFETDGEGEPPAPVSPAAAPTPPAPTPPVAPAAAPAPVAPAAVTPPVTPPVAPAVAPEVKPAVTPPAQTPPVDEAAERRQAEELLSKYTGDLEAFYKLPDDLAAQVTLAPEVALPKLAAKLHIAVENAVLERMQATLPFMIQGVSAMSERETKAKAEFYGANPDLVGYEEQVLSMGQVYRKHNPSATPQEATLRIGNLVRTALGMPLKDAPVAPGVPPGPAPARPAAAPQATPFRPASPGGAAAAPLPKGTGNPWADLAEELLADDA